MFNARQYRSYKGRSKRHQSHDIETGHTVIPDGFIVTPIVDEFLMVTESMMKKTPNGMASFVAKGWEWDCKKGMRCLLHDISDDGSIGSSRELRDVLHHGRCHGDSLLGIKGNNPMLSITSNKNYF